MMLIIDLFCGAGGAAMGLHQALDENGIEHEIWGMDSFSTLGEAIPPAYSKYIMNQFLKNYVNLDYFVEKYSNYEREITVSEPKKRGLRQK